ncbi:Flavin-dependent monooxygenase, oxygenase subunit HsaA (plasmid) [Streptomyces sp. ADI95-16]|uniref:acyl-CoA dehydrogenase family protein n=1 Tax=unclassified Streptomyces TaxID=2593676 RepID=UPI000F3A9F72|nr:MULTISPECIES: acyl-CoA dehydrogenase family protein [unclassified Streptomyces]AYV33081.1 Flavin-dependent monooxygenase, oxygenase subunit HsaA [Streptomyces sp. ADI95-16]RPK24634.1 Flavin-dependent monooxygenase, oxygenase subunit HsaA [Streptomyces sp. ADI91-18]
MSTATLPAGVAAVAPPEPDLTPAEVVERAETLARTLVARQAETEERTYYAADTHAEFARAGLYRILVPRRYGGYEFGVETFMRVAQALARGCPSTGWMYTLGAAHALAVATLFGEDAQAEIFAGGDFISPATITPVGRARRDADGGWIIDGTFPYCSGAPYATHFIGHTTVESEDGGEPQLLLFIAPRSEWTLVDDWGRQLGLKGSGSHSITFEGGRIPAHFAFEGRHLSEVDVTAGTPGRDLHGNPEYGGGPLSSMLLESASLAVGMAQGALDAYEDLMRTRTTIFTQVVRAEDPDYQLWYGQAAGMIATADAAVREAARQWSLTCARGPEAFTREEDLRLATICREVVKLAWHAVEGHLFPTAGSASVRAGERIERVWRDMSTLHSHAGIGVLLPSVATREYSRVRFGVAQETHA